MVTLLELDDENTQEDFLSQGVSLWVQENDMFRSSTNLKLLTKLIPGVYSLDFNRDFGFFCTKLPTLTDKLYYFSDSITLKLIEEIERFWDKKDIYKANNLVHKRGVLLTGFPGTGKTSIVNQVSQGIIDKGGVVFKMQGLKNLSDYVGFLKMIFRKIEPDTPVITIIEELEEYAEAGSALLDFFDGEFSINHHVIICTSNNTEDLPESILRPSRIDVQIEVPLPSVLTRREYFSFLGTPSEDLEDLVDKTVECSLADLKEIYISIYLLDYSVEDAINKVLSPRERQNFLFKKSSSKKIGL
jgi:AAA+ superfamily predicted ATPase